MKPVDLVEHMLHAYWERNHEVTLSYVTDDVQWLNMALPQNAITSKAAMREVLVNRNMGFPEPIETGHHEVLSTFAMGDKVVSERLDKWKLRGQWMQCPACGIFEIRDGKIAVWRDYFDIGMCIQQFQSVGISFGAVS